ncbi:MAG TPA: hypothetical protein VGG06_36090 [Thermoanaerobaculia bacterium]
MELRPPPQTATAPARDRAVRLLLIANLLAVAALGAFLWWRSGAAPAADPAAADHAREVASKLKAAGALDEAAALYEVYLTRTDAPAATRANVAFSLGGLYLDAGRYESALRWFYEAESLGVGELADPLSQKVVHALERLGRHHSAQAVLGSRTALAPGDAVKRSGDDPVVARIGERSIYRTEVLRMLDEMPPEMAGQLTGAQRGELLEKYVADELLWRKAVKLQYDQDPEVRRRHDALLKQLAISKFIESDVVRQVKVDPADLENFFEANRRRYEKEGEKLEQMPPEVERDYRMSKIESEYQKIIESELATADVELFPEKMKDG